MGGHTRNGGVGSAVVIITLLLTGCGGDDDTDTADETSDASGETSDASGETSDASGNDASGESSDDGSGGGDSGESGDAGAVGIGTATVMVDGLTLLFEQVEPGPDDDYYTFCQQVAGTLQAVFPQVDESGNVLEGELSVILIEPGTMADDIDEPPEFTVTNGERFFYYEEPQSIDIPASGRSASGTVTLLESGAMDPESGELETTPFEATLEISC